MTLRAIIRQRNFSNLSKGIFP